LEFLFELIFEIIIEGSFELGASKKVWLPIRILAMILFIAIYVGFFALFIYVSISIMETNLAGGILLLVLFAAIAVGGAYGFVKKYKERRKKS